MIGFLKFKTFQNRWVGNAAILHSWIVALIKSGWFFAVATFHASDLSICKRIGGLRPPISRRFTL